MFAVFMFMQQVQSINGSTPQVLYSGLIQNYGLCIDRYAQHVYYIQGGNGGSISCHAYGSTPCNTSKYVRVRHSVAIFGQRFMVCDQSMREKAWRSRKRGA